MQIRCQRPIKTNEIGNKSQKCHLGAAATFRVSRTAFIQTAAQITHLHSLQSRRFSFDRMIHHRALKLGDETGDVSKAPSLACGVNKFPERMAPGWEMAEVIIVGCDSDMFQEFIYRQEFYSLAKADTENGCK